MAEIKDIRRTVDLYALVARDTRLKRTGAGWWAGACPFCGGRDRFVLKRTNDGWRWLCRGCTDGKYYDALDYVQRRENLDLPGALAWLDGGASTLRQDAPLPAAPQPEPPKPAAPETIERLTALTSQMVYELNSGSAVGGAVRAYLERRGFLPPTIERALFGAAEVFDPRPKRKRPALAIPYFEHGQDDFQVVAIKYRFVDDEPAGLRYIAEKGSFFDFYVLPEHLGYFDRLLVVEGELNLLSLAQVLPEIDLISTGSHSVSEAQVERLALLAKLYQRVYVWLDEPKRAAALAQRMGATPLRTPIVDGHKMDANAVLQRDLLHELVERLTGCACRGWTLAGWREANNS